MGANKVVNEIMADKVVDKMVRKAVNAEKKLSENFEVDGKTYLVRCPICGKENYVPMVESGICAWCGYNANEEK